jgi:hypothetical protein
VTARISATAIAIATEIVTGNGIVTTIIGRHVGSGAVMTTIGRNRVIDTTTRRGTTNGTLIATASDGWVDAIAFIAGWTISTTAGAVTAPPA